MNTNTIIVLVLLCIFQMGCGSSEDLSSNSFKVDATVSGGISGKSTTSSIASDNLTATDRAKLIDAINQKKLQINDQQVAPSGIADLQKISISVTVNGTTATVCRYSDKDHLSDFQELSKFIDMIKELNKPAH
jgi:hypothetical protein